MFLLIFLFLPLNTWAANWSKTPDDHLKVEVGVASPSYKFEIRAPENIGDDRVTFAPNTLSKAYIGLGYRNIGASFGSTTPTPEESKQRLGETSAKDYQLRFLGKRTYEFTYQTYNGMYVENSSDVDPSYIGSSSRIKRPDIKAKNFGFNFFWNFHEEDYSLMVAFDQGGNQKESGWGAFGLLSYTYSDIQGDTPFVPATATVRFGELGDLKGLTRRSFVAGTGLGGILTAGGFYATTFVAFGLGHQFITADHSLTGKETDNKLSTFVSFRSGLGYNGKNNVLGLQLIVDSTNVTISKGEVNSQTFEGSLFYAYRFDNVNIPPANWVSSWLD